MSEPIWEKRLSDSFSLREFPEEANSLKCSVLYEEIHPRIDRHLTNQLIFSFGSWGMERDEISAEDCAICCQTMASYDVNISLASFSSNLEYARNASNDESPGKPYIVRMKKPFSSRMKLAKPFSVEIKIQLRISYALDRRVSFFLTGRNLSLESYMILLLDRTPFIPDSPFRYDV